MRKYSVALLFCLTFLIVHIPSQRVSSQSLYSDIRVWFVKKDPLTGEPLWKNNQCCVFDPRTDISPNPKPISFETDYLPNVVQKEIEGAGPSAARAQAVAARTFGMYYIENPPSYCADSNPDLRCHVTDSTSHQVYDPGVATSFAIDAVNYTSKQYLTYPAVSPRDPIFAEFSNEHKSTGFYTAAGSAPYLNSVYDPITNGSEITIGGHGRGMSQRGAIKWGIGNTRINGSGETFPVFDYTKILAHYYTGVQMRHYSTGDLYWGLYRWNMLRVYEDNVFSDGRAKQLNIVLQNTGTRAWPTGTKLIVHWERCDSDLIRCFSSATTPYAVTSKNPGDHYQRSLSLTPPSIYRGSQYLYYLVWDLRLPDGTPFENQGWLPHQWGVKIVNTTPPTNPTPGPTPGPCAAITDQYNAFRPCALGATTPHAAISWGASTSYDPLVYEWKRVVAGQVDLTSRTATTTASVPLLEGQNILSITAEDTSLNHNRSGTVQVLDAFYDPHPPVVTFTPPTASNATALTLTWSGNDGSLGVGLKDYTLRMRRIHAGTPAAWQTPLNQAAATITSYTAFDLVDGDIYEFELTSRDKVNNSTLQTRQVLIDQTAPTSRLTSPAGSTISKTWTVLEWSASDPPPTSGGTSVSGVASYIIDIKVGDGSWQQWKTLRDQGMYRLIFEGAATTQYSFRMRATDRAANQEVVHSTPDLTFMTGTDSRGLGKAWLPLTVLQ